MAIISSAYTVGHAQTDGRRYVTETHVDHLGAVYQPEYLAAVGTDYAAVMTARATQIEAQLAESEAQSLIGAD